ncbi:RNA polymerase sigma factor [Larkinella soli]|uniref:RNA polymerase sigma factor n=1 Tax=Larkinella soli TaxID=1770527 RepID=UPI000FFBE0AD|nr:sigma-70 family RNA polymerase sigma factor [Larkinella soli]
MISNRLQPLILPPVEPESEPADHPSQEQVLWQAFRLGDRKAFAALLDQYYALLLRYGLRLCPDRDLVKDCLHDLFVDLWNQRERLDAVRSIRAYLLISFRRKLLKETRKHRRFESTEAMGDEYAFDVQFAVETGLIQEEMQQENQLKLRHLLEQLTKRQREALYLRFYQELDYDDIARMMSIQYHSAVNLVYESLRLLRKNWFLTLLLVFFARH